MDRQVDREQDGSENRLVLGRERAIEEDTARIEIRLRHSRLPYFLESPRPGRECVRRLRRRRNDVPPRFGTYSAGAP